VTGVEQRMVQAVADAAPVLSVDTLDRLRRILTAKPSQPVPLLARKTITKPQGVQPEWRQAA
jgi:hypothetical protein